MTLFSHQTDCDRLARQRDHVGRESQTQNWTILQACEALSWPYPVTDIQLRHFAQLCRTWNVKVNVSEERWWKRLQTE